MLQLLLLNLLNYISNIYIYINTYGFFNYLKSVFSSDFIYSSHFIILSLISTPYLIASSSFPYFLFLYSLSFYFAEIISISSFNSSTILSNSFYGFFDFFFLSFPPKYSSILYNLSNNITIRFDLIN